jgi:hypothetical protein
MRDVDRCGQAMAGVEMDGEMDSAGRLWQDVGKRGAARCAADTRINIRPPLVTWNRRDYPLMFPIWPIDTKE